MEGPASLDLARDEEQGVVSSTIGHGENVSLEMKQIMNVFRQLLPGMSQLVLKMCISFEEEKWWGWGGV